jgi:hypothetical protein
MLASTIALLSVATAAAQVCAGVQSFVGRPIALWAFGSTTTGNTNGFRLDSYGGGLRLTGGRKLFGDVEVGASHTEAFGGLSWLVGTGAAYQVSLNKKGTVQLCPEASVGFVLGPRNSYGTGQDYSETDASVGAGIGVLASHSTQNDVVPTASLIFEHSTQRLKDTGLGTTSSKSTSFEVIELGIGLVHRQQISLKPSVSIPVGLAGAPTSFSVTLVYSVGAPR